MKTRTEEKMWNFQILKAHPNQGVFLGKQNVSIYTLMNF